MSGYVHGYTPREWARLHDQAATLADLLHHDTRYGPGERVLEAGCGVGAQTAILARNSPRTQFVSLDHSAASLAIAREEIARRAAADAGLANVRLLRGDVYRPPFPPESFDHVFVCFLLEHLERPQAALAALCGVLRAGGSLTLIEGDHGSCYFHPDSKAARRAWQCLIDVQAKSGGDSLIGRRVFPLLCGAGLSDVRAGPREVYCDGGRPQWQEGFVRKTIIPMVEGVREQALAQGMLDEAAWAQGIQDLHATGAAADGVFCYTFFKGVGLKPG